MGEESRAAAGIPVPPPNCQSQYYLFHVNSIKYVEMWVDLCMSNERELLYMASFLGKRRKKTLNPDMVSTEEMGSNQYQKN